MENNNQIKIKLNTPKRYKLRLTADQLLSLDRLLEGIILQMQYNLCGGKEFDSEDEVDRYETALERLIDISDQVKELIY